MKYGKRSAGLFGVALAMAAAVTFQALEAQEPPEREERCECIRFFGFGNDTTWRMRNDTTWQVPRALMWGPRAFTWGPQGGVRAFGLSTDRRMAYIRPRLRVGVDMERLREQVREARDLGRVFAAGQEFRLGIGISDEENGVRVGSVRSGSGAADAGIEVDDIVIATDGEPLVGSSDRNPSNELVVRVSRASMNDTIRLTILRDGEERVVPVEVRPLTPAAVSIRAAAPPRPVLRIGTGQTIVSGPGGEMRVFVDGSRGLQVVNMHEGLAGYFGRSEGALVVDVGRGAPEGIQAGDVVMAIDGREVRNDADLRRILNSYRSGEAATFRVWREGSATEVSTRIR